MSEIRNEELGMKVAASPQIYEAMPESSIQVKSHSRLLIPNP